MKNLILFLVLFVSLNTWALTCQELTLQTKGQIYSQYRLEEKRLVTQKVLSQLKAADIEQIQKLSRDFNLPHTPEEKYALQNQARALTRQYTQKAGYRLLNAPTGTPYDALIEQTNNRGGFLEFSVEVRSLLIMEDPLPHATLWLHLQNPSSNPWNLVSVGVRAQKADDYASWATERGRLYGSIDQFVQYYLRERCP